MKNTNTRTFELILSLPMGSDMFSACRKSTRPK